VVVLQREGAAEAGDGWMGVERVGRQGSLEVAGHRAQVPSQLQGAAVLQHNNTQTMLKW